jgi:hypothetical protein
MQKPSFKVSMRGLFTLSLLALSTLSFTSVFQSKEATEGTNQSYILFDNGEVSTVRSYFPNDNDLKLIDADHIFILPGNAKETRANYLIDKDNQIYTLDAHGFMYHKEFYRTDSPIRTFGGNYFITRKGQIHIVRNDGILINYNGLPGIEADITKLSVVGGNFFITNKKQLIMITDNGYFYDKTEMLKDKANDLKIIGNNYAITKDGYVYTFGTELISQIDANGKIMFDSNNRPVPLLDSNGKRQYFAVTYRYDQANYSNVVRQGGNYFFDTDYNIHTIANNGLLDRGIVNRKLKVNLKEDIDRSRELPVHFGNNYFVYGDGALYMVDNEGYFYFVKKLDRRVSQTNFESKINSKKLR